MAAALAALWLPAHPNAAISLAAGQLVSALNFFFLTRLVKLFTGAARAESRPEREALRARGLFLGVAKVAVVYGGAFALTRWRGLDYLPLTLGLSMPLIAIVLKSIMLALRPSAAAGVPSTRRAPSTASPARRQAKLAASILLAGVLALPLLAAAQTSEHASTSGAPAHEAAAGEGKHEEGGELPNWITIANDYAPNNPVVHWMHENQYLVFAWLAGALFLVLVKVGMKRDAKVPGHLQNGIEWIVESMENVAGGMLGKHLPKYFPFIMSIFFYILMMNLIGIVPGFKSSTSTIDVTLALALVTFLYVQVSGIINLGPLGYLDHLAGSPRDVIGFAMLPVMIPVHVLGELVKPVSLSCRLFGNIFGEDTLIVVFVGVAAFCLKASLLALAVPPMAGITALFMLLQMLTAIVQALIFSLLTTVYLYMMIPHESHGHEEAGHAH